jgi:predicted DNA-binding transcriptional regulator AlpA
MSNKEKKKEFVAAGAPDFAVLNVKELEAFLKIDQKTIYRYVSLGLIPYVRIQSNIRFVKQQIVGWIEEQNFRPNSQIPTNQSKR